MAIAAVLLSLVHGVGAPVAAYAVVADDLCAVPGADPCVIDAFHPIEADVLELHFGNRAVLLTGNGRLAFIDPDPQLSFPPDVTIRSGQLTTASGSAIVSDGGRIRFRIDGDAVLEGDVSTRGLDGADGGDVEVRAGGLCRLTGTITTIGGRLLDGTVGDGGSVLVHAGGDLIVDAGSGDAIDASGGGGNAEDGGGGGGTLDLRAAGDLRLLAGRLRGVGRNDGGGSTIVAVAGGAALLASRLEIDGGPSGFPGDVSVVSGAEAAFATNLACRALSLESAGPQLLDGDVSCREITVAAGGSVEIAAGASVRARDVVGNGGPISITSGATVLIGALVHAGGLLGGAIRVFGCGVSIAPAGVVDAGGGPGGTIDLGGVITIDGVVDATSDGAVTLTAPASTPPVVAPGAPVAPAPTTVVDDTVDVCCALDCDDGDPCTADVCTPQVGCTTPPNAGLQAGCAASCAGAPDGRPCRADACATTTACAAGVCPVGAPLDCADGDVCNGAETCDPAVGCLPGAPLDCDDRDACNGAEGCDPVVGCTSGAPLADGTLCVVPAQCIFAGACDAGQCVGAERCDDGEPCHRGVCVPGDGCSFVDDACPAQCAGLPNGTPCSNEDICDAGNVCLAGACQGGPPRCPDGDACTSDFCDPARGCVYFEFGLPPACIGNCAVASDGTRCFDGSLCTSDVCAAGECVSTAIACDDGDPTNGLEYCEPSQGCLPGVPVPTSVSSRTPTPTPRPTATPTVSATATLAPSPVATPTPVVDAYVLYKARASKRSDLPDGGAFPRRDYNLRLDDVVLADAGSDDPENYEVGRERSLVVPVRRDAEPGPSRPGLHYVRYRVREAREGVGGFDGSRYPKAVKHVARAWDLENAFGTIGVTTKKVEAVLVPAALDAAGPPSPPADATHYLCYQAKVTKEVAGQTPDAGGAGKFRRDLQTYAGGGFLDDDCALDRTGTPGFAGTAVAGACLLTLKKVAFLCNPVAKADVGGLPPRVTIAPAGSFSSPTTGESLLCYQARLAKRMLSATAAALGSASVGDALRQSKHVKRTLGAGTAPHLAPGNAFPAPRQMDTTKLEFVCLPTAVLDVTAVP